jgi:1-acyl-sn-glycerol-3-phosphate acyltransferase
MATTKRNGTVAAAADRASGERRRRRGTPLISGSAATPRNAAEPSSRATSKAAGGAAKPSAKPRSTAESDAPAAKAAASRTTHRPAPSVSSGPSRKARRASGARSTAPQRPARGDFAGRGAAARLDRPLKLVSDAPATSGSAPAAPQSSSISVVPGVEEILGVGVAALRAAATATGIAPEQVEQAIARTLAYIRRRVEGDYEVDDFGFDADFTEHVALPLLRPLYKQWFRVEVRGIENIPSEGGALVVANHSGTVAVDSLMTQVAVHDEHPDHRFLRMLGADLVFNTPFLGTFARRSGSTLATNPDAERLLTSGELVGVWPEGFKGVGKPFKERYKLQRFGRGGFVSAALRTGAPIIPCSIVGAEEIYPIIGNAPTLARLLGLPYFPIVANMALGPLAFLPLPSNWIIEFGRPVDTASLAAAAADDPMVVFDLTDQVRETIQQSLYSLLVQRRSVFS